MNPPLTDERVYYGNFEAKLNNFWTNGSYYCILTRMGILPDRPLPAQTDTPESIQAADLLFAKVKHQ